MKQRYKVPFTSPRAPKLTSKDLSTAFIRQDKRYVLSLPNVYPDQTHNQDVLWKEFDVLGVRKSGYIDEIEIKLSRSDFKNDFNKTVSECVEIKYPSGRRKYEQRVYEDRPKHKMLEYGKGIPNYFYFLTPRGLLTEKDIPTYCGWLEADCFWNTRKSTWDINIEVCRKAKLLHKNKINDDFMNAQYKKGYYRYISELTRR